MMLEWEDKEQRPRTIGAVVLELTTVVWMVIGVIASVRCVASVVRWAVRW